MSAAGRRWHTDLARPASGLARWFAAQLQALFPRAVGWWHDADHAKLLRLGDRSVQLYGARGAAREAPVLEFDTDLAGLGEQQVNELRLACGTAAVDLVLPPSTVLRMHLWLPQSVARSRGAIELVLQRESPLMPHVIAFDWRVWARATRPGHVDVAVWMCRREHIGAAVRRLGACGVRVGRVGAEAEDGPPGLAQVLWRAQPSARFLARWSSRQRMVLAALALAVVLPIATGAAAAWLARDERARTQKLVTVLREQTAINARLDEAVRARRGLDHLAREPRASVLLDDLARVLPQSAWLVQLEFNAGAIQAAGWTTDAAAVEHALRDAPLWRDARLLVRTPQRATSLPVYFELTATPAGRP